jgi:serine/threonine-protein kinase
MGTILKYKPKTQQESNYRVFDDRYRLLSILGQGRESVVYRGVKLPDPHPTSASVEANLVYALKVFTRKTKDPEQKVAQIMREASAMLACRNENVVQLYDVVTLGELCYLVMEYVDGGNLATALNQKAGPAAPQLALLLAIQTLNGLESVHAAGIIHRDIKPANLLVTKQGGIKIADFSIARLPSGPGSAGEESLGIGTFDYLAPECLEGSTSTFASDIYAVAVTTYQLLTNHLPFEGDSLSEKIDKKMENKYLPIRHFVKDAPKGIDALIRKGLMVEPAERYQTVGEFRSEIENFIKGIKDPKYRQAAVLIKAMQDQAKVEADSNVFDISNASAYSVGKADQEPEAPKAFPPRFDPRTENYELGSASNLPLHNDFALDEEIDFAASGSYRRYSLARTIPALVMAFALVGATLIFHPEIVPPEVKEVAVEVNATFKNYLNSSLASLSSSDLFNAVTSESAAPTPALNVSELAEGKHTLVLKGLGTEEVMLTIKRMYESNHVLMVLHLPNATPQIVPAKEFLDNQEIVHHDLGYSLSLSVNNVDEAKGLVLGGRYIEGQSGKTGTWHIQQG